MNTTLNYRLLTELSTKDTFFLSYWSRITKSRKQHSYVYEQNTDKQREEEAYIDKQIVHLSLVESNFFKSFSEESSRLKRLSGLVGLWASQPATEL